jgi:hypothetical protein
MTMPSMKKNGQQGGTDNVAAFENWKKQREIAADWADWMYAGRLNRKEISTDCGFARSCWESNPTLQAALAALETNLEALGVLRQAIKSIAAPGASDEVSDQAVNRRVVLSKNSAEKRVKTLEEQNASLRAELIEVREQLRKYKHLDDHLCTTGRLIHQ